MVANFKVGQTAPVMYFFVALFWYLYRRDRLAASGGALVGAILFKPYVGAPLAIAARLDRVRAIVGSVATYGGANALSLLMWGSEETIGYYHRVITYLYEEGQVVAYDSFAAWSPSHIRMFYWLGPYAPVMKVALLAPLVGVLGRSILQSDDDPVPLFVLTLVALMIGLKATSAIDMAILLAAIIVLAFRFYIHDETIPLVALTVAFLALQIHEYVLELLVGWGAQNLTLVAANEQLLISLLPVLQPGTYGIFILYALGIYASARSPDAAIRGWKSPFRPAKPR